MAKLTKAQQSVLSEVREKGAFTCTETYAPARKLIDLGLVHESKLSFSTIKLTPTQPDQ